MSAYRTLSRISKIFSAVSICNLSFVDTGKNYIKNTEENVNNKRLKKQNKTQIRNGISKVSKMRGNYFTLENSIKIKIFILLSNIS